MKQNKTCTLCGTEKYFIMNVIETKKIIKSYSSNIRVQPFFKNLKEIKKLECLNCGIRFFDYVIEGNSDYYAKISGGHNYYNTQKREFDKALEIIKQYKPNSLLEIGCGNGYFLEKLPHVIEKIAGTELNKEAIKLCTEKGINIVDPTQEDQHGKYDMVVSFQVFEHINDSNRMIELVKKLLNPGGIFLLAVPNPDGYLKNIWNIRDIPPHHVLLWTKKSFEYLGNFGLNMINYFEEDLSYQTFLHYIWGIQDLPQNRLIRFFINLQKYWLYFIGPSIYAKNKFDIKGHTHLGVFKKI